MTEIVSFAPLPACMTKFKPVGKSHIQLQATRRPTPNCRSTAKSNPGSSRYEMMFSRKTQDVLPLSSSNGIAAHSQPVAL